MVEVTESYRATIQATVKHFTDYEPTRPRNSGLEEQRRLERRLATLPPPDPGTGRRHALPNRSRLLPANLPRRRNQRPHPPRTVDRSARLVRSPRCQPQPRRLHRPPALGSQHNPEELQFRKIFSPVVGCDNVAKPKPNPEGLIKIVSEIEHAKAWYIGDTVDDARAASAAKVPFIGIAATANPRYSELVHLLKAEGAVAILDDINSLEAAIAAHS